MRGMVGAGEWSGAVASASLNPSKFSQGGPKASEIVSGRPGRAWLITLDNQHVVFQKITALLNAVLGDETELGGDKTWLWCGSCECRQDDESRRVASTRHLPITFVCRPVRGRDRSDRWPRIVDVCVQGGVCPPPAEKLQ